jgi:hypothetical protein
MLKIIITIIIGSNPSNFHLLISQYYNDEKIIIIIKTNSFFLWKQIIIHFVNVETEPRLRYLLPTENTLKFVPTSDSDFQLSAHN